jgi:hypothetical protein
MEAMNQENDTMARKNSLVERVRRTVSEILDVFKGQELNKTAALQPVPVRADVPVIVRRSR